MTLVYRSDGVAGRLRGEGAPALAIGNRRPPNGPVWIDEDLSPSLVAVCHEAGYEATSVRDRGKLSARDHALAEILLDEGWVLVTNNAGDFLKLATAAGLHPGLVFVELGAAQTERECPAAAIAHIEHRVKDANEAAEQFMVNRVVEVDDNGPCADYTWP
jgi:predicted nuclease of predicted toxin-antitoxin system